LNETYTGERKSLYMNSLTVFVHEQSDSILARPAGLLDMVEHLAKLTLSVPYTKLLDPTLACPFYSPSNAFYQSGFLLFLSPS
jgi:hypothetical protein